MFIHRNLKYGIIQMANLTHYVKIRLGDGRVNKRRWQIGIRCHGRECAIRSTFSVERKLFRVPRRKRDMKSCESRARGCVGESLCSRWEVGIRCWRWEESNWKALRETTLRFYSVGVRRAVHFRSQLHPSFHRLRIQIFHSVSSSISQLKVHTLYDFKPSPKNSIFFLFYDIKAKLCSSRA